MQQENKFAICTRITRDDRRIKITEILYINIKNTHNLDIR